MLACVRRWLLTERVKDFYITKRCNKGILEGISYLAEMCVKLRIHNGESNNVTLPNNGTMEEVSGETEEKFRVFQNMNSCCSDRKAKRSEERGKRGECAKLCFVRNSFTK